MQFDREHDLNALVLYQACGLLADRKTKMTALASDWPRYFRLLFCNYLTEFNECWQKARFQSPLSNFWFWTDTETKMANQYSRYDLELTETFSASSLQNAMEFNQFMFFCLIIYFISIDVISKGGTQGLDGSTSGLSLRSWIKGQGQNVQIFN